MCEIIINNTKEDITDAEQINKLLLTGQVCKGKWTKKVEAAGQEASLANGNSFANSLKPTSGPVTTTTTRAAPATNARQKPHLKGRVRMAIGMGQTWKGEKVKWTGKIYIHILWRSKRHSVLLSKLKHKGPAEEPNVVFLSLNKTLPTVLLTFSPSSVNCENIGHWFLNK